MNRVTVVSALLDTSNKRYTTDDMFRASSCVFDNLFFNDERTQVNGIVFFLDMTRYALRIERWVSMEDRKNYFLSWQVR